MSTPLQQVLPSTASQESRRVIVLRTPNRIDHYLTAPDCGPRRPPPPAGERAQPPPTPVPHLPLPEGAFRPILAAPRRSHRRLTGTEGRQRPQALTNSYPFLYWEACITGMSASPREPMDGFVPLPERPALIPRLVVKKRRSRFKGQGSNSAIYRCHRRLRSHTSTGMTFFGGTPPICTVLVSKP